MPYVPLTAAPPDDDDAPAGEIPKRRLTLPVSMSALGLRTAHDRGTGSPSSSSLKVKAAAKKKSNNHVFGKAGGRKRTMMTAVMAATIVTTVVMALADAREDQKPQQHGMPPAQSTKRQARDEHDSRVDPRRGRKARSVVAAHNRPEHTEQIMPYCCCCIKTQRHKTGDRTTILPVALRSPVLKGRERQRFQRVPELHLRLPTDGPVAVHIA